MTSTSTTGTETSTYGVTVSTTTTSTTSNSYNFTYMQNRAGAGITWTGTNASIYHLGAGWSNVIGQSIYYGRVSSFGWTFKTTLGKVCVGLYSNSDINSVALDASLLDDAQVICSDNTYYNMGKIDGETTTIGVTPTTNAAWTLTIDLLSLSFNITNKNNGGGYFGFVPNINTTYYVVFFKETGLIKFAASLTVNSASYMKKMNTLYASTSFPFTWLAVYNESSLRAVSTTALVQSLSTGVHNMFGQSISTAKIIGYSWTFLDTEDYACVGLIESNDIASVSLTTDVRNQSIAICSDNTVWGVETGTASTIGVDTVWTISIDYLNKQVNFTQNGTAGGFYTASFNSVSTTYYTVQFDGYGAIEFGGSLTKITGTTD